MRKSCQQFTRKTRISNLLFIAMLSLGLIVLANTVWAAGEQPPSADDKATLAKTLPTGLAKASQNPVANIHSSAFDAANLSPNIYRRLSNTKIELISILKVHLNQAD